MGSRSQYRYDHDGRRQLARCRPIQYPGKKGIWWKCYGCEAMVEAPRPPEFNKCEHGFCRFDPYNGTAGKRFNGYSSMKDFG